MSKLMQPLSVVFLLLLGATLFFADSSSAENGEALFGSLRCNSCHKPDQKSVAASLAEIAGAYGDREKLMSFFKGESKPVIETDKTGMMRGQMPKLKALSDEEKKALIDYIFSFN